VAFKSGHTSFLMLDTVAGVLTNLSPYIDNTSAPQSVEQLDVSAFGTAAKAFIPGLTDGDTISISGPYDVAMHTHLTNLKAAQSLGSSTASFLWGPGGSVAAQAKVSGEFWLASYELSSGVGGRVEYSASLQVSGAVANSTF
jgi:hypothetical protein